MPLILHIDTATSYASVCISKDGVVIAFEENGEQTTHASFLQPAIKNMAGKYKLHIAEIDAVAVTNGPGSYTGLRVGLASAKGLCFALNKPLILLNTLEVMAASSIHLQLNKKETEGLVFENALFCPMIDARRMEVFTAVYSKNLNSVVEPAAMVLNENSFAELLKKNAIVFSGDGSLKLQEILQHPNAFFSQVQYSAKDMVLLANEKFEKKDFASLAYSSPNYLKEFYTPAKKIR